MDRVAGGRLLVESLAELGVRTFFGVPGESFLEVLDTAELDARTQLISTRHESGASFMAEASAKLTGVPAVAMATRAVGASNLAIGVHTAFHDSTPLIAMVGQVDQRNRDRDGFQEIDLRAFYRPITKWTATFQNAARARELAYRAYTIATTGRPGPVLIELPADALAELVDASDWPGGAVPRLAPAPQAPPPEVLDEMIQRLGSAERPVVIAGGGAQHARDELITFAERYGLGVYASFRRQDVFPNDHPQYLGHLTLGTSPVLLAALRDADVVLVLGSRLSEVTSQNFTLPGSDAYVIQVDIDAASFGAGAIPALGVVADVSATLRALLAQPHDRDAASAGRDWSTAHGTYVSESTPPVIDRRGLIHPADVISVLGQTLPAGTVMASDAGNFSIFLHRYWRHDRPKTQLAPTSGAMGYGVPAAVAAKIVSPERTVVALAGDGGFLMSGQELETAVRYDAPIVVVVLRNGLYGTIAMHQLRRFGRMSGVDIGDVDLASYAAGVGAESFAVAKIGDLAPSVREALARGRSALIDVAVDPEIITPSTTLSSLTPA